MKLSRKRHSNKLPNALVLLLLLVYPVAAASTEDPRQDELDAMASKGRDQLLVQRPDLEEKLDQLPGYAVIAMTTTKIPGVGTGMGLASARQWSRPEMAMQLVWALKGG